MSAPVQWHMPRVRRGHTTAVTIGGERFHLTANERPDGNLGEVFIRCGKQGSTVAGLLDGYATALSVGLRHGVPLADLLEPGLDASFAPGGRTDDPEIPRARSAVDYFARRLAFDWLTFEERASLGVFTISELAEQAGLVDKGPRERGQPQSAQALATGNDKRPLFAGGHLPTAIIDVLSQAERHLFLPGATLEAVGCRDQLTTADTRFIIDKPASGLVVD